MLKKLTGLQIASIIFSEEIFSKLNIKYLGAKNITALNVLINQCVEINNILIHAKVKELIDQQNEMIIKNHEEFKDLLQGFFTVRHNLVASNKYIADHKELEPLVPEIEANNQKVLDLQTKLLDETYDVNYNIDVKQLEIALENTNFTLKEIQPILFLLTI